MTDDKCPRCGAVMISGAGNFSFYACMSYQRARGEFHETCGCLRRQLSTANAEIERLAEALREESDRWEGCVGQLARDLNTLSDAGGEMAEAASRVVHTHDGVHRLALAVSRWMRVVADEYGRGEAAEAAKETDNG